MNVVSFLRPSIKETAPEEVRRLLREGQEIALLDVREEAPFASGHPLFAVNLPLGRIEERVVALLPRRTVPIIVYDNGEGRLIRAVTLLRQLGYTDVSTLEGDLQGWKNSGGEIFIDVNVPSKAFGELVEHVRNTPSLPAEELKARLDRGDDLVILDARRFSEYNTMSIPQGRSVPGGELALRVRDIAPSPTTTVVVNCAGRTRSIIGTQSLVNAGIPNPVFALRNGTIGWTLAGFALDHGADQREICLTPGNEQKARSHAVDLAVRTGVRTITPEELLRFENDPSRSLYKLDVRSPEEYQTEHLAGFHHAPGGQLVQATDEWVGVRHGTLVLTDTDGVRARMAGHWLRQLGWQEVYVLDDWFDLPRETGPEPHRLVAPLSDVPTLSADDLAVELKTETPPLVLDLATSPVFRKGHIPEAFFILPADLVHNERVVTAGAIVLTSPDGHVAHLVAPHLQNINRNVRVLKGGTRAWEKTGRSLQAGLSDAEELSAPVDVYKRPYEGTDNARVAMQAYLDWEFGLIAQLERDGTHGFNVLK